MWGGPEGPALVVAVAWPVAVRVEAVELCRDAGDEDEWFVGWPHAASTMTPARRPAPARAPRCLPPELRVLSLSRVPTRTRELSSAT